MDSKKLRAFNGGVCVYSSDYYGKVKIHNLVIETRNTHEAVTLINGFNSTMFNNTTSMLKHVRDVLFQNGFRVHTTEQFGSNRIDNIFFVDTISPEETHRFYII